VLYPTAAAPVQPRAFAPLPLGAIRPQGWLADQLWTQAHGLTGHLDEIWPDLGPDNMWLGGASEGWERAPYYLDGLVPLAYLLDSRPLKDKAVRWVEAILAQQDETGWIGPAQAPNYGAYDAWPNMIVLKVLSQYSEATSDPRAVDLMRGFGRYLQAFAAERPLYEWGRFRWADLELSLLWLQARRAEAWLLPVAAAVMAQGYDWTAHFRDFQYKDKTPREACRLETHVVNNAMAVKTPAVAWLLTGDPAHREATYLALANLDRYHGQVTGVFSGDEHYAGLDPSQGTELCAVVELMFSLECLLSILGDPALGDRLERVAYNALPGTCTADMWAHQYDQQVNQVLCTIAPRQWTNNGDDANIYGLEPNYGCCTANLHQGWPKLVSHLWMATADGGLAAVALAPCRVTARVRGRVQATVQVETDYPFGDTLCFRVGLRDACTFPLSIRIPEWADGATLRLPDGETREAAPGTFQRLERAWRDGDEIILTLPMEVRTEPRPRGATAVVCGPLVYSMPLGEQWTSLKGKPPAADWEIRPTTPWNYGLDLTAPIRVARSRQPSLQPFSGAAPPVELKARGRLVPGWQLKQNSAGPLPQSPCSSAEPEEDIRLVPYGCTQLRITEFPVLAP
jgi:uncharacterized protein